MPAYTRSPLLFGSVALLFLAGVPAQGEDDVRATQEELRRRNIYFGDVDGRSSNELTQAVKRYQQRKGFAASGAPDGDTLRSLGIRGAQPGEAPPKELEWPEEPVLRGDSSLGSGDAVARVSQESGIAEAILAPAIAERMPGAARGRKAAGSGQRRASAAAAKIAATPRAGRRFKQDPKLDPVQTPRELQAFVQRYLQVIGQRDLLAELCFYADRVNYFGQGSVDRRVVEAALRDYYSRWPKGRSKLIGGLRASPLARGGEITVVFRVEFEVRRDGRKVRGVSENQLVLQGGTARPRIVSVSERRVRG